MHLYEGLDSQVFFQEGRQKPVVGGNILLSVLIGHFNPDPSRKALRYRNPNVAHDEKLALGTQGSVFANLRLRCNASLLLHLSRYRVDLLTLLLLRLHGVRQTAGLPDTGNFAGDFCSSLQGGDLH